MTDWKSLRHAYGDASDVPALLGQLSPDPRASAWDEIWSRLCHQGTVYSASFAALPHLLLWAQARSPLERGMVLPLAGAIIASRDVFSGAETRQAAVDATASGLEQAGLEALEEPALTPSDFIHVAQAVLACRGDALWGEQLDRLASGEFEGVCPHCRAELHLVVGQYGFFTTAEEWVKRPEARRVPITPTTPRSLVGVGEWLHGQATAARQAQIADWLLHLFGRTGCPTCGHGIGVVEAIRGATGPT